MIHLDKALARIREYERMKLKAQFNPCNASTAGESRCDVSNANGASANPAEPVEESAANGVHCPQIDTQQLDRQIKAIMTEVIPFLKENMNKVCSHQLLTSVRRMVLTLTQQHDESKEFVRFFHKQLGGILQESLGKFVGRTLKDCGEDLLVEISEILFNELAFFKLMQDLDSSTSINQGATSKNKKQAAQLCKPKHNLEEKTGAAAESDSPAFADEDKDQDETAKEGCAVLQESYLQTEGRSSRSSEASPGEEEEEEDEGHEKGVPLSISLSKAETQALTNYGSGEDENDEDDEDEFQAGPVDVQTSLQVSAHGQVEQEMATASSESEEKKPEESSSETNGMKNSAETFGSPAEERTVVEQQNPEEEREVGASAAEESSENSPDVPKESSSSSSPNTDSPVLISADEVGSGNTSQRSDEEDFVKLDDVPLQLTVMCEEELQKRIVEEQQNNNLSVEILNRSADLLTGLVGNAQALKEPETAAGQNT